MSDLIRETRAIRGLEAGSGHWMGMMSGPLDGSIGGLANRPGRVSFSVPNARVMVHELGHNMSLAHAPCGAPAGLDPAFPYPDGSSGVWGYDFDRGRLVRPSTPDVMAWCADPWISDYHFTKALRFRLAGLDMLFSRGIPDAAAWRRAGERMR